MSRTVIHKNIDYVMGLLAFTEKKESEIVTDDRLESACLKINCDGLCVLNQEKVPYCLIITYLVLSLTYIESGPKTIFFITIYFYSSG